jgi:2-haloacid dehalogenase/putative hydrolase of the HAD superfamily
MEFDLITFDCYGTLIDWEGGIIRAFQSEALKDELNFDPADIISAYMIEEPSVEAERYRPYREVLAEVARRAAARLGWEIDPGRASFLAASLSDWLPFPDTNPALERLAERYRLGILSNVDDDLIAGTLRHFAVKFDLIVTAEQVKSYKPAPAHFREALARARGSRLLHAAQSYFHDVAPALELGIPVAWINRKREGRPGPPPTYELSSLEELADLLAWS